MASLFDRNGNAGIGNINDEDLDLDQELDLDGAISEIAKYLPMGSSPSERNLTSLAMRVAEGEMTAQEAAIRLSSKKIITLKK